MCVFTSYNHHQNSINIQFVSQINFPFIKLINIHFAGTFVAVACEFPSSRPFRRLDRVPAQ